MFDVSSFREKCFYRFNIKNSYYNVVVDDSIVKNKSLL